MSSPLILILLPQTKFTSFCGSVSTGITFFSTTAPSFPPTFPIFFPRNAFRWNVNKLGKTYEKQSTWLKLTCNWFCGIPSLPRCQRLQASATYCCFQNYEYFRAHFLLKIADFENFKALSAWSGKKLSMNKDFADKKKFIQYKTLVLKKQIVNRWTTPSHWWCC